MVQLSLQIFFLVLPPECFRKSISPPCLDSEHSNSTTVTVLIVAALLQASQPLERRPETYSFKCSSDFDGDYNFSHVGATERKKKKKRKEWYHTPKFSVWERLMLEFPANLGNICSKTIAAKQINWAW